MQSLAAMSSLFPFGPTATCGVELLNKASPGPLLNPYPRTATPAVPVGAAKSSVNLRNPFRGETNSYLSTKLPAAE